MNTGFVGGIIPRQTNGILRNALRSFTHTPRHPPPYLVSHSSHHHNALRISPSKPHHPLRRMFYRPRRNTHLPDRLAASEGCASAVGMLLCQVCGCTPGGWGVHSRAEQEKESTKEREYLEYFTTFSTLIII